MSSAVLAALTVDRWSLANRNLLAKAITELMYEQIIHPDITPDGDLTWQLPNATITAKARRRALGWWRVEPGSLRYAGGDPPDAAQVLAEVLVDLGCDAPTVAQFVAELSSTLLSDAHQVSSGPPAAELVDMEPVLAEAALGGHPWIVANKGRIGFSADDLAAYAPEMRQDVRLHWLAATPGLADMRGLTHTDVIRHQVGDADFDRLRRGAADAGLDPDTCAYVPAHPWQWTNRVLTLHAGDLARGQLVHLGQGTARYRPQLAIRTMTDVDHPSRRYLKLPLSVLNTSVYRGLPRERTMAAPDLTTWLLDLVASDPFLAETGLILLGEVASVSVPHQTYQSIPGVPYQHTEMLGAIWRESVSPYLRQGEQALPLAALLHVDGSGKSIAAELVARSGLDATQWCAELHDAVLSPLLHVLYRYGLMFSPHGQNCMIVHHSGMPVRLVVKDFVDDLAISTPPLPEHATIPAHVRHALRDVAIPPTTLVKYLHNGLLIGVYRYLAEITDHHLGLPESQFWALSRETVLAYQTRFADDLSERFDLFDLQTPTFPRLCLNRLRLFERGYRDNPERPVITAVGTIPNPLSM